MQAPAECSPNTGGSNADPEYNNPTYQLFNATNNSLSPALALSILLESWPINSYPWLCVLPSGSVLIIAGIATELSYVLHVISPSCSTLAFLKVMCMHAINDDFTRVVHQFLTCFKATCWHQLSLLTIQAGFY